MKISNKVGEIPYEKSNNVETSLFLIQGRISKKDFWIRTFMCVLIWAIVGIIYLYWETPNYYKWVALGGGKIQLGAAQIEMRHQIVKNISYYILPAILLTFIVIQAAKRAHDCNRSSKYLLVPFYNVFLMLANGTPNNNDYGLLPHTEVESPSYKFEEKTS